MADLIYISADEGVDGPEAALGVGVDLVDEVRQAVDKGVVLGEVGWADGDVGVDAAAGIERRAGVLGDAADGVGVEDCDFVVGGEVECYSHCEGSIGS